MAEKVMNQVEKGVAWVGALIIKGPIALMDMAKGFVGELLGGLRTLFFDAFVNSVFNSIAEIAGGNLQKAVAAVENSLAKGLPVAIGFLANLVGICGIASKVKEIIQKIRKPIDKAVGKTVGVY